MFPIKLTRIVALVLLLVGCQTVCGEDEKPNFIIINIDDLGYGDTGPFGSTQNRTPHLDQMAEEGRKLTCFYAAPVCSPSRAALMTGCYPKRALNIPHVLFPAYETGLASEEITVAELLKQQGYATGIIGKWHLGDQPEFLPTRQGFDFWYGLPYSNDMGPAADGVKSNPGDPLPEPRADQSRRQPPLPLLRNETVLQRVLPDDQQKLVERYTQEAVSFLWKHRDEPFFLYLPHSAVHFPLYPGKRFQGTSQHGLFGDWVEEVDWSVGQILKTVRDLNLSASTMVLFTSDNGGQPRHGAINAPLRGGKGSTFEGGMRVPTIAWWPGKIPAGTSADQVTSMMDVLPTLVKLAGGTLPTDRRIDGGDIWPILAGSPDARSPHDSFYYYRGQKLQAVRSGPWKLHLQDGELYNLEQDIAESRDVSSQHAEIVAMLQDTAAATADDLGIDGTGPGCRAVGRVADARPLIAHDGTVREGFGAPEVYTGQGIMVGEVTSTSALVQMRLTQTDRLIDRELPGAAGVVEFSLRPDTGGEPITLTVAATAERDFIARAAFSDLQPGTSWVCTTRFGTTEHGLRAGPTASFHTLAGATQFAPVKLVVVTGMNYGAFHGDDRSNRERPTPRSITSLRQPYSGPDKHLGYPALDAIRRLQPDFFVGTGDNIYYDSPKNDHVAKTLPQMRRKWHEQFSQPRFHDLFAVVPTYWMVDDHDYRDDDCDNTGDYEPSVELGQRVMLEQLPYGPAGDNRPKTYRTHRVSRDLQIWIPENRMYRSPNSTPDGPDKTIWGAEQKAWLMQTLADSDATFKLLISPTPMIGPDDKRKTDNHTNIGGFRHERDEFFWWLRNTGTSENFYLVCGDRHWQYHSLHPSGLEEFSCGALVDANSRIGRNPGDPQSTDPDGLIRQPYSQTVASGGFLEIECLPAAAEGRATLIFRFHDERGEVLHEHTKTPSAF